MITFKNFEKIPVKDKEGDITGWKYVKFRKNGTEKYVINAGKDGTVYGYDLFNYDKKGRLIQESYHDMEGMEYKMKKYKYSAEGYIKETEEHYYDIEGKEIKITKLNKYGKPDNIKIYMFDGNEKYLESEKKYYYSNNELVFVEEI